MKPVVRNKFTSRQLKWLSALESGQFAQVRGTLCGKKKYEKFFRDAPLRPGRQVGYCCLGVANKVCRLREKALGTLQRTYGELFLHNSAGRAWTAARSRDLVALNDQEAYTFAEIAAAVRAEPWVYFTNFDPPADLHA